MSDVTGGALPLSEHQGGRPGILVVEDEVLVRLFIAAQLRAAGYLVIEAANAAEALLVLSSGSNVSCVISDVRMPGSMDGLGLARFVRSKYPAIKIVLVSGHFSGGPEYDGFFPKPYETIRLIAHINSLCR